MEGSPVIQNSKEPVFALTVPVHPGYKAIMSEYLTGISDESIESVVSIIGELLAVMNSSQWVIGDLLNYIRSRVLFDEEVFVSFDDLLFNKSIKIDQLPEPTEFLYWQRFNLPSGDVILAANEDNRYWKYTVVKEQTDIDFKHYVNSLELILLEQIGSSSLWNYFRVAQAFPPSQRGANSWTWYLTKVQHAAIEIGDPSQRDTINEKARQIAAYDDGNGFNTVSHARAKLAVAKSERKGWRIDIDSPAVLYLNDGIRKYPIIEFKDEIHAKNICIAAGVIQGWYDRFEYIWDGVAVKVAGKIVARTVMETAEAEAAVYEIAKKLKFSVG